MSEPQIVTYVTYMIPGAFVANEDVREVTSRDPYAAARRAPSGTFAFRFHERVIVHAEVDGETVTTRSRGRNYSGTWYLDGEVLSAKQVAALPGDHQALLDNMRSNRWDRVVQTRNGWMRPFGESDAVISSDGQSTAPAPFGAGCFE